MNATRQLNFAFVGAFCLSSPKGLCRCRCFLFVIPKRSAVVLTVVVAPALAVVVAPVLAVVVASALAVVVASALAVASR